MHPSITGKKLVIFDLDGTLTPSKQYMRPSVAEAVSSLIGVIKVAIISGEAFGQFEVQFLRSLPPANENLTNLYILTTSGARIYTWKREWHPSFGDALLSPADKKKIFAAFEYAFSATGYVKPATVYGEMIEDRDAQITFSAFGQKAPLELKQSWDPTREKREKLVNALREKLPEFDVKIGGTTSIDVTLRGVNKGYGIHKLEQHLGIPLHDMIFVGDALYYGGNDYPAKATGVDCIEVSGPEETEALIRSWLQELSGRAPSA